MCLACCALKPKRSFHCDVCKTCVERYDHHCFWINNCVGAHNFTRFILFIIMLELFFMASLANGVLLFLKEDQGYYLQLN